MNPLFAPRKVLPASAFIDLAQQQPDTARDMRLEDRQRLAGLVAEMLASPAGREVFEHLLDITLRADFPHPLGEMGGSCEKLALATAFRKGQNFMPLYLLKLAAQAAGEAGFALNNPPT